MWVQLTNVDRFIVIGFFLDVKYYYLYRTWSSHLASHNTVQLYNNATHGRQYTTTQPGNAAAGTTFHTLQHISFLKQDINSWSRILHGCGEYGFRS